MELGESPTYETSCGARVIVPIVTVTGEVTGEMTVARPPGATTGLVGPKPVPYSVTMSPGFAAWPDGTTEGFATTVEVFANWAAMLKPLSVKNAGARGRTE